MRAPVAPAPLLAAGAALRAFHRFRQPHPVLPSTDSAILTPVSTSLWSSSAGFRSGPGAMLSARLQLPLGSRLCFH
eukprot:2377575-Pyramimonas_sp.AAC.1